MARLFVIISAPQMYGFVSGHAARLRCIGYQTTVISADDPVLRRQLVKESINLDVIPIERNISVLRDAVSLMRLCLLMIRQRPDAVMMMGPKANLLGNIAAWLMAVPRRITLYVGIRQETMTGFGRWLIDACDLISLSASTSVLAISPSLRVAMIQRGIIRPERVTVTGWGTTNGIDGSHFTLDEKSINEAVVVRANLGLPVGVPVIGFIGRLTEDKGLVDVWNAFGRIRQRMPTAHLMLVGAEEVQTDVGRATLAAMSTDQQVRVVGQVHDVRPYMHISWVHLLPSYREGFGNATAEAAALAIPAVAYRVTGVADSVVSGQTGQLMERGDIIGLADAVLAYLSNHVRRANHGLAARRRTLSLYHPDVTWSGFLPAFDHVNLVREAKVGPDPIAAYIRRELLVHGIDRDKIAKIEAELSVPASPAT